MNKPIGGYFELELPHNHKKFPHSDGVLLNSGRHSLEYILQSLGKIKRLWIPYFTCDVVLQPLERLQIPYSFYRINQDLTIAEDVALEEGEYIIYTNYYGIMDAYCKTLASIYSHNLIIDNAQALYAEHLEGIKTFYSPRKFVGVPDGGIAYIDNVYDATLPKDVSYDRCSHLLKRHDLIPAEGYKDFRDNSHKIAESPMSEMSNLTEALLLSIDFDAILEQRLYNFNYLHEHLASLNGLQLPPLDSFVCPLVYPFYAKDPELKKQLISNQVFVATYWPNVLEWCKAEDIEYELTTHIIALPIDQRFEKEDMDRIIKFIFDNEKI